MSRDLNALALEHQWGVAFGEKSAKLMFPGTSEFSKAVTETLGDIAAVLENFRKNLDVVEKSCSGLYERTSALFEFRRGVDSDVAENKKDAQMSSLKSFFLWSLPFTNSNPSSLQHLTNLERQQQLLSEIEVVEPQIKAIHVSIDKAYASAKIARALIDSRRNSWLGRLEGLMAILGRPDTSHKDMMDGVREAVQMALMLMEQKVQRTGRRYRKSLATVEAKDGLV